MALGSAMTLPNTGRRLAIRTLVSTITLFLVAYGMWLVAALRDPLRRPAEEIRLELLQQASLGSSEASVRAFVEGRGWLNRSYVGDNGFLKQDTKPPTVVGVRSLSGYLGRYRALPYFIFWTHVTVFWGFDADGRLIDIWVWKDTDAI